MVGEIRNFRWLIGAAVLAAVECAGVGAVQVALTTSAQAQRLDDRYPFLSGQRPRAGGGFRGFFGNSNARPEIQEQTTDYSRAPSPHKPDPKAPPIVPSISIMVMGDGMADWLAYGLEDAFADSPEIGVIRKNKIRSGLLRYEFKSQLDWWNVARDELAKEKVNYVIMMLGVSDRQNIREKDIANEPDPDAPNADTADKDAPNKDNPDQPSIIAPEPKQTKKANGVIEFRSDRWAQVYSRRIDETVAALKSKGVPVFWVGLPSIRGTKSTADAVYLNDLYRTRAERAGAIYIDVWDGFVDETGKFTTFGPDYEGQMRRLRSGDGVYFTKSGARKLAHFVERELRRAMSSRVTPVALPVGPVAPVPAPGKSAVRPLIGPVVPLTVTPTNSDQLLGGAGAQPAHADAIADRVLVKGEPVPAPPGRADDFAWPPGAERKAASASAPPVNAAAPVSAPVAVPAVKPAEQKTKTNGKTSQITDEKKPPSTGAHRTAPRSNPLGWLR
jgi:hypothetical protein